MALCSCASREAGDSGARAPYYHSQPQPGYSSATVEPAEAPWPRAIVNGSTTNLVYQPQADFWDGHQLTARDAVAVQEAGQPFPTYGVVTLKAITLVDKTRRTVSLENIQVVGGYFPAAQQHSPDYLGLVRNTFPKQLPGVSLDRLEASFVPAPSPGSSPEPLNNAPPKVIVSDKPAILVSIDGPPTFGPVPGTEMQRVINARVLLLKDKTGTFYVHVLNGYLEAPSLEGPWTVAGQPPKGALEAANLAANSAIPADLLEGKADSSTNPPPLLSAASAPVVYVSTKPAELILFDGQPDFTPIPGTQLLYAANTTANVFKLLSDQQTYLLLSGRWFRAPSFEGPWQFVPADHLPQGFADIPDNSPKENVKACVPGTRQAAEALIANSIPESTAVPRTTQMQNPQIDGAPRLEPIAGTPLHYVANSGTPIIKVDEHSWYACQNGVWFVAASIDGPWTVAASVPAVIYSIPPSSPLHYLTYVQVYGAAPQEVYEGYTPGYLGTEVEDGVVVYGTGYYYPPWIGVEWYGWPYTWGFGWGPCWTPWDDWCFDFGFGWGCGFGRFGWWRCHPPRPWGGPGRNWHHEGSSFAWRRGDSASTAGNVYARRSTPAGSAVRPTVARADGVNGYARAYNSRTGTQAAGQRASMESSRGGYGYYGSQHDQAMVAPRNTAGFMSSGAVHGNAMSGYGRAGVYGGGYSHAYGSIGGHSHGGWGPGASHGGGGDGGHSGGGGGHGGGGGGHGGGGR